MSVCYGFSLSVTYTNVHMYASVFLCLPLIVFIHPLITLWLPRGNIILTKFQCYLESHCMSVKYGSRLILCVFGLVVLVLACSVMFLFVYIVDVLATCQVLHMHVVI